MKFFCEALKILCPNSEFLVRGEYLLSNVEWVKLADQVPTQAELEKKAKELQDLDDAKEYARKRAAEYPSFADQFDLLYHGGYDAWKTVIDQVKAKYPKP